MSWKISTRGERRGLRLFFPACPVVAPANCETLITPFGNAYRVRLATAWMNEEWYNDRIRSGSDPNWVSILFSLQTLTALFFSPLLLEETRTLIVFVCFFLSGNDTGTLSDLIMIFGLIRS